MTSITSLSATRYPTQTYEISCSLEKLFTRLHFNLSLKNSYSALFNELPILCSYLEHHPDWNTIPAHGDSSDTLYFLASLALNLGFYSFFESICKHPHWRHLPIQGPSSLIAILCKMPFDTPQHLYLECMNCLFNSPEWEIIPVNGQYGLLHLACSMPKATPPAIYEKLSSHADWITIPSQGPHSIGQLAYTLLDQHPDLFPKIAQHPQFIKIPAVEAFPFYGLIQLAHQALLKRNQEAIAMISKLPEWNNIPSSSLYHLAETALKRGLTSSFFIFSTHPGFQKLTPNQLIALISFVSATNLPKVFLVITKHPHWNLIPPMGPFSLHTLLIHDLHRSPQMLDAILNHPHSNKIPIDCLPLLEKRDAISIA